MFVCYQHYGNKCTKCLKILDSYFTNVLEARAFITMTSVSDCNYYMSRFYLK